MPPKSKSELVTLPICPDHPKYQAEMEPRVNCISCWVVWTVRQIHQIREQRIADLLF